MRTFLSALLLFLLLPLSGFAQESDALITKDHYLVVVGMASEAKIARGSNIQLLIGAMRKSKLQNDLARIDLSEIKGVISFGVAAGTNPRMKIGQVIVSDQIIFGTQSWHCSLNLNQSIRDLISKRHLSSAGGVILGADDLVSGTDEWRSQTYAQTGADAVDMESHIMAEFAESHGLPFTAVRVLSDSYGGSLPPAALLPLDENGEVQLKEILESIASNPFQIPALLKVRRDFNTATKVLSAIRRSLDSLFDRAN